MRPRKLFFVSFCLFSLFFIWGQFAFSKSSVERSFATSALLAGTLSDETGTGVVVFDTLPTFTTGIIIGSTDPADAGAVRLNNLASLAWEASPAGTDETITLTASENFEITSPILVDFTDPADTGAVRLDNNEALAWEASPAGTDITLLVDATEVMVSSGTFSAAALISDGNITSPGTGNIGWTFVDGTDNTTGDAQCTSACVFGIANATGTAVTALLTCTDATADSAICAGSS